MPAAARGWRMWGTLHPVDGNLVITNGSLSLDSFGFGTQPSASPYLATPQVVAPTGTSSLVALPLSPDPATGATSLLSQFIGADATRTQADTGAATLHDGTRGVTAPADSGTGTRARTDNGTDDTTGMRTGQPPDQAPAREPQAERPQAQPVAARPKPKPKKVAVRSGDTLSKIAAAHGTTWQKLYAANKGVIGGNPNLIRPGQQLVVPGKMPGKTAKPTPPRVAPTSARSQADDDPAPATTSRTATTNTVTNRASAATSSATATSPAGTGATTTGSTGQRTLSTTVTAERRRYLEAELARTQRLIDDGNRMANDWYATLAQPSTSAENRQQLNENINDVLSNNEMLKRYAIDLRGELGLAITAQSEFAAYGLTG